MVGQGFEFLGFEPGSSLFCFLTGQAVNNTSIQGMFVFEKSQQLIAGILFQLNTVANIGSIKTRQILFCVAQFEARDYLGSGLCICCRRQRNSRYIRKLVMQQVQFQVVCTKVVAPLGHAVSFVDRKQADGGTPKQR